MEEIVFAKCPKCGEELEVQYIKENNYFGVSTIEVTISGTCPNNCHKKFQWTEIFEYVEHRDVTCFD